MSQDAHTLTPSQETRLLDDWENVDNFEQNVSLSDRATFTPPFELNTLQEANPDIPGSSYNERSHTDSESTGYITKKKEDISEEVKEAAVSQPSDVTASESGQSDLNYNVTPVKNEDCTKYAEPHSPWHVPERPGARSENQADKLRKMGAALKEVLQSFEDQKKMTQSWKSNECDAPGSSNPQSTSDVNSATSQSSVAQKRSISSYNRSPAGSPAKVVLRSPLKRTSVPADAPPLLLFRRGILFVSDFGSQCWCEQQMDYSMRSPAIALPTPQMQQGSSVHLARELEVQTPVAVEVVSREDQFAVKLINMINSVRHLLQGPQNVNVTREVPVFAILPGTDVYISGIIDELRLDVADHQLTLVELKTRQQPRPPSKSQKAAHVLQAHLYKYLLDIWQQGRVDIKEIISSRFLLQLDVRLGDGLAKCLADIPGKTLAELVDTCVTHLRALPPVTQCLLEYVYQGTGATLEYSDIPYNDGALQQRLGELLGYWTGERAARGVDIEEAWKCRSCEFSERCEWRIRAHERCVKQNSSNNARA